MEQIREVNGLVFAQANLVGRVPDVMNGGIFTEVPLIQRIDPIFDTRVRFVRGAKLQPDSKSDISALVAPGGFCPFCPEVVDRFTFPFPAEMVPEGKIRRNKALVVPNILAYSTYSAVGIYDTTRHFVPIEDFDSALLSDAIGAMVSHAKSVRHFDPGASYSSINANYLPPSGSSLIHPHLQSSHDYVPLTRQAQLIERARLHKTRYGGEILADLVEAERSTERFIGTVGGVDFLAPWAPGGFREVWAVVRNCTDIIDLSDDQIGNLSSGLATILGAYASWNLLSFNFALMGGGPDAEELGLNPLFRIVARSNPDPVYRSDVTYFERLYGELMVDVTPEETAEQIRAIF